MKNSLNFCVTRVEEPFFLPDHYSFAPPEHRLKKFLAKQIWKLLHKLRALRPHQFTYTRFVHGPAEAKKTSALFQEIVFYLLEKDFYIEDYIFVIGGKEYSELISDITQYTPTVAFEEARLNAGSYYYRGEWHGVRIHIAPGFSGVAAIRKIVIETTETERLRNENRSLRAELNFRWGKE